MRFYKKQLDRLKKTEALVKSRFSFLGTNKRQEITRLLFEISKRESIPPESIVKHIKALNFLKLKDYLLRRRYPYSYMNNETSRVHLPKLKLSLDSTLDLNRGPFSPRRIFVEKKAAHSYLAKRFKSFFPEASFKEIISLKHHLKKCGRPGVQQYNQRCKTIFITYENYDFFKKCPCTKRAVNCGYHIFNLSFGCIFECTYCYLQEYTNTPGLIFPANLGNFFDAFESYKRKNMRAGTGEFSDSLMLDYITEYSLPIVEFFARHPEVTFEFKTKSTNINNLLKIKHAGNIVVAWSLNPQRIIEDNEFLTPSLSERIHAAGLCASAGYKLGFHFDPVIYFDGWETEYKKLIELLFSSIKARQVAWISIGTLRFKPKVKQIIEMRFPENKILDEELVIGFDNKLRYPYGIRRRIYNSILKMLSGYSSKLPVYLCMEEYSMWRDLNLAIPRLSNLSLRTKFYRPLSETL